MFDPRPTGRGQSRRRCPEHVKQRKRELIRARDMVNRTDRYHLATHGHAFVNDPDNTSELRRRCLTCRQRKESTPQFCPQGHEYTPENKRIVNQGKRACQQCIWDRTHVPQFGHPFVPDPNGGSTKRQRCLTCHESKPERTHCVNGHEYTDLTTEYTATR